MDEIKASRASASNEKVPYDVAERDSDTASQNLLLSGNADDLQRKLSSRQIQMIAIGGSIGTALFVSIGSGLIQGGPGSLFIAFVIYSCLLGLVNNCMAEMAVFMPVSGSFVRMGSRWIDEAYGFGRLVLPGGDVVGVGKLAPVWLTRWWKRWAGTSSSTRPCSSRGRSRRSTSS